MAEEVEGGSPNHTQANIKAPIRTMSDKVFFKGKAHVTEKEQREIKVSLDDKAKRTLSLESQVEADDDVETDAQGLGEDGGEETEGEGEETDPNELGDTRTSRRRGRRR